MSLYMDLKTLADFMSQVVDCKIVFLRHLGRHRGLARILYYISSAIGIPFCLKSESWI